ncbi:MAG: putative metal-dependent hydrolase [Saprospiraceae bacterium]|nr:putative metal-dependent hydrolase [Saprospiraceae bacterium]MDW8229608.1 putative metal-dependent hydrolase [Saprospiraceae bacterium]
MDIIKSLKKLFRPPRQEAKAPATPKQESQPSNLSSEDASSIFTNHSERMKSIDNLRYPIGKFEYGKTYSLAQTRENIQIIERLPTELRKVLRKIGRSHFDVSYRPGGWTVRQVVHHLADSHMNAFLRLKMALTEPTPVIKPYEQDLWAQTADVLEVPVKVSLRLLTALHRRAVTLLESLTEEDLEKGYFHPERNAVIFLPEAIASYAWHCKHHLAHLNIVAQRVAEQKAEKHQTTSIQPSSTTQKTTGAKTKVKRGENLTMNVAAPKMSRREALAKARAARAAKRAEQGLTTATAKAEKTATAAEKPKLSRAEALSIARAARAAKRAEQGLAPAAPTTQKSAKAEGGTKMSRAEALAKARAARAAKRNEK